MFEQTPTIVLVHGAFAESASWNERPAQAVLSDGLPSETPAWQHLPSWFVFGDQDLNIPVALQRFLADRAGPKGTREIAGGSRAIIVSHPDAVTATSTPSPPSDRLPPSAGCCSHPRAAAGTPAQNRGPPCPTGRSAKPSRRSRN